MTDFQDLILEPLHELFLKFKTFLPNFLAMLVIVTVGVILAKIIRFSLVKFLTAVNFDNWADRAGFTRLLRRGDLWSKPSAIVGAITFWLLIIVTLMIGMSALKITTIDILVDQFFSYMPRVFSAAIILIAGFLLAGFASRAVLIAAVNGGYQYAKILAETVRTLLTVLILAMAMEQLQIAPGIVLAAFSIIFGGIVVALAISFGVGGIDAAKRIIERKEPAEPKDDIEHL